jgi:antitoxin HicB
MKYPALFTLAAEGGFVVTFRDLPEAITQGDTEHEAMEMAEDVLYSTMELYLDDKRPVPLPSKAKSGEKFVFLPPSAWAKVLLLNEMIAQKVTASELARRLHTRPQDINRVINLEHVTKIDMLDKAFQALGKHLEIMAV